MAKQVICPECGQEGRWLNVSLAFDSDHVKELNAGTHGYVDVGLEIDHPTWFPILSVTCHDGHHWMPENKHLKEVP